MNFSIGMTIKKYKIEHRFGKILRLLKKSLTLLVNPYTFIV